MEVQSAIFKNGPDPEVQLGRGRVPTPEILKTNAETSNLDGRHHRHMVGGLLPAPGIPVNGVLGDVAFERLAGPDVVEPASPVGCFPVRGPITPPGIDLLGL